MPRVVAPIQAATAEELQDTVHETIKKAHQVLDAAAVAKTLEGLGIGSNASSEIRQIGEAFSGLASGLKSVGELQATLIGQISQMLGEGNGKKSNLTDLIGLILVMKMLEPKKEEKREELSPVVEKLLNRMEEEIRELKESRGPSPVDQHIQSLTTQLLSQHIATLSDPFSGLAKLAEMKDQLKSLIGEQSTVPPEYTEGALRLRAIEKEEKAIAAEQSKYLAELSHKEKLWSQQIPAVLAQAGAVLANVLGAYGLTPTRQVQFDEEASSVASSMAENAGKNKQE